MKFVKTITDTFTWAASADKQVDIPKDGVITQIAATFAMTMNAALTAVQPNGLWNIIQNFKIESGGRSFLGLSGELTGRIWGLVNAYDYGNLITLQDGTTESITFVFHPGADKFNPYDLSCVIPAQDLGDLKATWTTTANSVVDDTITISSGTGYLTVWYVTGLPKRGGVTTMSDGSPLMVPLSSTTTKAHDATYSDLSYQIAVPTNAFLRRVAVLVQDETSTRPVRKDDEITRIGFYLGKENVRLIDITWEAAKAEAARYYGVKVLPFQVADTITGHAGIPDGFTILDFRPYSNSPWGLDLRRYSSEDIKILATIGAYTSGDDSLYWFDMMKPWSEMV